MDQRFFGGGFEQREAQAAVGEHPAQRAFMRFGREIEPSGLVLVSYRNAGDVAGEGLKPVGDADVAEQMPAGGRDRGGAIIEAFRSQFGGIGAVDDVARKPVLGRSQRQRHADKPAAKDQQVACFGVRCAHAIFSNPSTRLCERHSAR